MTTKKALSVVTARWQEMFIAALREGGHVGKACEAAKVSRTTAYTYRRQDAAFAADWDTAIEDAAFSLEDEGLRRARDGVDEPIVYKGMIVGTQKRYSDTLLMFLLKGIKPDKYADKVVIRISPEHAALLQKNGLSASEMWDAMMQELAAKAAAEVSE